METLDAPLAWHGEVEGNCSAAVAAYVQSSLADNTHRAYGADLAHFRSWGGTIPCGPQTIAEYLAANAGSLSMATLERRMAAISQAHQARGLPSPTQSGLVRATRRGIKRVHGTPQKQAAALVWQDLTKVADAAGQGSRAIRDRALLLLGFAGAFRRSELVGLDLGDLEFVPEGLIVQLRRSKTDQVNQGRRLGIAGTKLGLCPVQALRLWLQQLPHDDGPVFRRVDRHGTILRQRLSSEAVSLVVKKRAGAAGLDPDKYSGHSLRAGFATAAARAHMPSWRIRQQTGHASDAMLARYIREGQLFSGDQPADRS